jgi:hypothetical protein
MDLLRSLFLLLVIFAVGCRSQGGIFGFLTRLFGGGRRTSFVYPTSSITTFSYPSPDNVALAAAQLPAILPIPPFLPETVTETVTITDIFTSISVQQELVTLPAWIRWQVVLNLKINFKSF